MVLGFYLDSNWKGEGGGGEGGHTKKYSGGGSSKFTRKSCQFNSFCMMRVGGIEEKDWGPPGGMGKRRWHLKNVGRSGRTQAARRRAGGQERGR